MRNFQKRNEVNQILQSKPVLIFLGVIILVFIWSLFGIFGKMEDTATNKKNVEDKITELQKEKEKLSSDINNLKTTNGIEENIRDKFGLAKDGEGMVVIVDDKDSQESNNTTESKGFFTFLKNLFK